MSAVAVERSELADDRAVPEHLRGTRAVLSRGLRESPDLRSGLAFTVVISLAATTANLVVPILIQQIFDHGFDPGFRPTFVFTVCAIALAGRPDVKRIRVKPEEDEVQPAQGPAHPFAAAQSFDEALRQLANRAPSTLPPDDFGGMS